jgi:hypothetical protein
VQSVAELGHKWFEIGRRLPARQAAPCQRRGRAGHSTHSATRELAAPHAAATAHMRPRVPSLHCAQRVSPAPNNNAGRIMPSATDGRGCSPSSA